MIDNFYINLHNSDLYTYICYINCCGCSVSQTIVSKLQYVFHRSSYGMCTNCSHNYMTLWSYMKSLLSKGLRILYHIGMVTVEPLFFY